MNKAQTRAAILALPYMVARCTDGEWRVTINVYDVSARYEGKGIDWCDRKQEALACYTDDAEDALGTARAMSAEWARQVATSPTPGEVERAAWQARKAAA